MPATPAPRNDVRASARALSAAFADVAKQASPSVVSIRVEARAQQQQLPPGLEQFFGGQQQQPGIQRGGGTGVVLRNDGHILTNNHVVENANRIDVSFQDGRTYRATLVGTDPASDLAVVKIDAKNLVAARFANSDEAEIGEWVVAIGSPFGLDYTVTTGVLSAKGRGSMGASEIGDYLQTDASINPGNSGGPLVNLDGEVLGINTFIIGRGTGIGFAIPSSIVQNVANQIVDKGVVRRAWIGVSFQEMTPELASYFGMEASRGALVSEAVPGGPAAKAGIQSGDVIMTINDRTLANSKDLQREVLRVPVGTKLHVGRAASGQSRGPHDRRGRAALVARGSAGAVALRPRPQCQARARCGVESRASLRTPDAHAAGPPRLQRPRRGHRLRRGQWDARGPGGHWTRRHHHLRGPAAGEGRGPGHPGPGRRQGAVADPSRHPGHVRRREEGLTGYRTSGYPRATARLAISAMGA
jgi:serine protease Do